jgi:hypothetical protein
MDNRPLQQPEGTYPYGKNGIQHDMEGAVMNEEGFRKMAAIVPYRINGIIETDSKPLIFSTNNTVSAIGFFNPETELYESIFDDTLKPYKLGFKVDNWITGTAQRNYKGELVSAFTDKFKFPKFMNCDNLVVTSLNDWNLFPFYKAPTIKTSIVIGGRLPQGTYYVAAKYSKNDGTETPYSPVSLGKTTGGDGTGTATDKALEIQITNADPAYDFVTLAVVSKVSGVTTAVEMEKIAIAQGAGLIVTIYTGDNLTESLSLEEILTPAAVYSNVGKICQLNDALYIADLEKEPDINNMQPYANIVRLKWKSELMLGVSAPLEHTSGEKKGYMHEEVYAVYIQYEKTTGGFTKAYHCPGIVMDPSWRVASTVAASGALTAPKFKTDDIIGTFSSVDKTGTMGPWENANEVYPSTADFNSTSLGGPDLRGKKVLHHKMPSLVWCKENLWASESEYGRTKLDILGIYAENVIIPTEYIGRISGYRLLYAKRTVSNMTVYGQSLTLHGAVSVSQAAVPTGTANIYSSGGNWNAGIFHKSKGSYVDSNDLVLRRNTLRFHSFDMIFNRPGVNVDYMSVQLKLGRSNVRASYYMDGRDGQPQISLIDYTTTAYTSLPIVPPTVDRIRKLTTGSYAPNGISTGQNVNVRHETAYVAEIKGSFLPITVGSYDFNLVEYYGSTPVDRTTDTEQSYLANLKGLKEDLYNSFMTQSLVLAGSTRLLTDSGVNFGGDVYVCDYTFHTYGRHSADEFDNTDPNLGKKIIRRFVCEAVSNIHLRYETPNEYSKWYPHNTLTFGDPANLYPAGWDRAKDPNQFGYSSALNALNDLLQVTIYSPYSEFIYDFPHRIQRGGKMSKQSKTRSWRTFLPLDYYDMQKNMGFIVNMEGMDDKLLIHTENALFLTQDKAKLDSGLLGVTLGSGDIFQFEPQEASSSKLGYAGTQHEIACVRTPMGYIFVDSKMGEIYLFKGELQNISEGISRFLRDYLKVTGRNPLMGNGITVGWDQKYKRILLSVKSKTPAPGVKVKEFKDTADFWSSLVDGDVVRRNGRYIVYQP